MGQAFIKLCRSLAAVFGIGAAVAMTAMAVLFAASYVVFSQGSSAVEATLRRSIQDGTINVTAHVNPVIHFWNGMQPRGRGMPVLTHDCLIWTTLIVPKADTTTLTLRTLRLDAAKTDPDGRGPPTPDCQAVLQALDDSSAVKPAVVPYDRYIIGQRWLVFAMLTSVSPKAAAQILQATVYGAFILALLLALRRKAYATCAMCLTFILFYGLSYYGATFYFGPMDLTHAAFIIGMLLLPRSAPTHWLIVAGAVYGALVAQFEILTGGIPVALATAALAMGIRATDLRHFLRDISLVVATFCVTFVLCFAIRLCIVALVDGSNPFATQASGLLWRMRGDVTLETPPDLIEKLMVYRTYPLGEVFYLIAIYRPWTSLIGGGSPTLGSLLVIGGFLALVFATIRSILKLRTSFPPQLAGCWLAIGFLCAWMALFWNHTLVHPFFMARILVIIVLAGAVATTVLLFEKRPEASSP